MKKRNFESKKVENSDKKDEEESEDNTDSMYLKEMREELNKAAQEFRSGETEGKKDSKIDKMFKLINMIKLSSTIKILKDDNTPVEIIPHLFLGSIGSASNLKQLQNFKITHILCCATGIKNFFPDKFKYYNLNLLDSEKENIKKFFDESFDFIDKAIKIGGNVLVHCHAGISRSSTIIISYIMKSQKVKLEKALEIIKSKREKASPNQGFLDQLKEYEKELGI
jgi:protein-tyrosine phosphatase